MPASSRLTGQLFTSRILLRAGLAMVLCLAWAASGRGAERQVLRHHVPKAAKLLAPVGRLEGTKRLNLAIGLPLRNQQVLAKQLHDLYDPKSPSFRQYLTPAQFTERFGPTVQDYEALVDFAKAHGLTVSARHPNRVVLDVQGAAADVEKAFHVALRTYQHPTEARQFYAPDAEPSLDAAVPVLHISGLDNYAVRHSNLKPMPENQAGKARPNAGSAPGGAYAGSDFRAAYVPGTALTGAGQCVGLVQFDGYYASDITAYETKFGLPNVPLVIVSIDGGVGTPGSGNVEVSLDIEMSVSMAPGLSAIYVYEAPNPSPWEDMLNQIANDNTCKQVSCSWGDDSGPNPTAEGIFQQMAIQGQSFFSASGDNDAFTSDIGFPADSPNITLVGGTTLTTSGPGGTYVSETVWNAGGGAGSSGGISTYYPIPTWQQGISMTSNQGSTTLRNVPDVALTGDNVYIIYQNGQSQTDGGTSCAAPLWAGFTALVNQQAALNALPSVGFINPAIYAIGSGATYTAAFHDTTTGNNFSGSSPAKFSAVPGYDLCTGLGTPNGAALIDALSAFSNLAVVFNSASDVPVTASSYNATGQSITFALNFAPTTGTTLMVVNNTGLGLINGTFSNLAQGQAVALSFEGVNYNFVANYYGGTGNDLVLQWASTLPLAWGDDSNGQLGNNSTTQSNVPVAVSNSGVLSGRTITALAAGNWHSLALCADGTLAAWGGNSAGQLGNDSTTNVSVPGLVDTTGVLATRTIVAVTAGASHSLVLCADGTLATFGSGFQGQLGNGSFLSVSSAPLAVIKASTPLASRTVVAVAAGCNHNLALCSDGTMAAWGDNSEGELGDGTMTNRAVPVAVGSSGVLSGKTVTAVAAGGFHSLALGSDGTLYAWGSNQHSQLGSYVGLQSSAPVTVGGLLAGKTVIAMAAGTDHSLALCSDGTLYAWGSNALGQLGTGSASTGDFGVSLVDTSGVLAGKTVVAIAAGIDHSMALCSDGTLAAWGEDSHGQLGDGGVSSSSNVPVAVSSAALATGARFIMGTSGPYAYHSLGLAALPPSPPIATTLLATLVTATSATLNGTVNGAGSSTTVSFDYGADGAPSNNVVGTPASVTGSSDTPVSAVVTGLTPGATYHYRVNGSSGAGTSNGADVIFATPSNNASLSGLALSDGTLSPAFDGGTLSYTAGVLIPTTSITVTPVAAQANASITVNGAAVASGAASGGIALNLGPNTLTIAITAQDGVAKESYTVTVTRAAVAPTVTSPSSAAVTASSAMLGGNVTSDGSATISVRGVVLAPTAAKTSLRIGGTGVTNITGTGTTGVFAVVCGLLTPDTSYSFAAYATNRVGTGYSATGTFTTLSNNCALDSLVLSSGSLSPLLSFGTTNYTATVVNAVAGITVTPTAAQANASITVNGVAVASGSASSTLPLNLGPNTVTTVVTAQDGTTTATYTVVVTRSTPLPTLGPPSSTNVTGTSATLGATITSDGGSTITSRGVVLAPAAVNANPQIGGTGVFNMSGPGTAGAFTMAAVGLAPGTAYSFAAYAFNSAGVTYSATGTFATPSTNASLSHLTLGSGTLSPVFAAGTFAYSVTVPSAVSSLILTPTAAQANAALSVNGSPLVSGSPSQGIALGVGLNTLPILVTAQDGTTTKTYTLKVTRTAPHLVVQQPAGVALASGAGSVDFGGVLPLASVTRVFTIKNTGNEALTGLGFAIDGVDAGDFSVPPPASTSLAIGGGTTFTVTFKPAVSGVKSATLHVTSDDPLQDPFDIALTGTGAVPPAIGTPPASRMVALGSPAGLTVSATGGALSYQWLKNGQAVPGATGSIYNAATALTSAGSYTVKVSNVAGPPVTSLVPANLGVVNQAPAVVTVVNGSTITLGVAAAGPGLTYQWKKGATVLVDGENPLNSAGMISGAGTPKLSITKAIMADADDYTCVVSMPDLQNPGSFLSLTSGVFTVSVAYKPVLDGTFAPGPWVVGGTVTDQIKAQNNPTSFTLSGQPAGVTIDAGGYFHGKPTVAITGSTKCHLVIGASNAAGAALVPVKVDVMVNPLPENVAGTFNGLVDRDAPLTSGYGGTLNVVTLSNGTLTGKLGLGAGSCSFTGSLDATVGDVTTPATITILRALPLHNLTLALTFHHDTAGDPVSVGKVDGTVTDVSLPGSPVNVLAWRSAPPPALATVFTAALQIDPALAGTADPNEAHVLYPQGDGFGTLTVTAAGVATWSGHMSDGAATTASVTMGPHGEVPLHFMLYTNTGSAHGWVQASGTDPGQLLDSMGTFDWMKGAQTAATLNYKNGFPLHHLTVTGAKYIKPTAASPLVLSIPSVTSGINARLLFSEGGLAALSYGGTPVIDIAGAANAADLTSHGSFRILGTATANSVSLPNPNTATIALAIGATTGTFSGSFVLHGDQDPTKATKSLINRTAAFSGVCVTRGQGTPPFIRGAGYFLLPELQPYPGLPVTASPLLSGQVLLQQGP